MDGIRKKLYQKTISYINNLSVHSRYFILENRTHYPVTKVRRDAMKIGFIGAGKVGFSLGKYLADNNQKVIGYYSEFTEDAKEASKFTNSA